MHDQEAQLRHAISDWQHSDPTRNAARSIGTAQMPAPAETPLAAALLARAEAALSDGTVIPDSLWHEYLDVTAQPAFLQQLPDSSARERWARTTFSAIRASRYSLRTMLAQRARAQPDHLLFVDRSETDTPSWSYAEIERYTRAIAGVLLDSAAEPRVAIFCDNCVDGASVDLACLAYGMLVTPLNVHLDEDTLAWISERLDINIVITDTDERHARIATVAARTGRQLNLFRTGRPTSASITVNGSNTTSLRYACARIDLAATDQRLAAREIDIMRPATVMFTSGSTGHVKGVVFSEYMLLAKRFARGAALPSVGYDEVLLCYLPLFHTFGRFLELLGMIYWRGTYVFVGNPSAESLIAELARVQPTGLIGVPVRWTQIRDHCLETVGVDADVTRDDGTVRRIIGNRLRWGLSAAGFLDPQVFRFFHRNGVDLCSGFGMTEATGGITMTPPGGYVDGTVGIPLPGIEARLNEDGELQIAGAYVAAYLAEDDASGSLPRIDPDEQRWIATGDLFRRRPNGYYEIVDRIKDIYKNTRGQTVAPQRIERRFANVPGIRSVFLVGDHRDHNVLLIVPDTDDPLLAKRTDEQVHDYFAQIVVSANTGLAPYERVVEFALLPRDFDGAHGELTPKGSFRRKAIEKNFEAVIDRLYRSNHVELAVDGLRVRIPRWFYRDLGILEHDIVAERGKLRDRRSGRTLPVRRGADAAVRVGDLEYQVASGIVELGTFARQPRLWLGNMSLAAFAPCKAGWDVPLREVSERVRLPRRTRRSAAATTDMLAQRSAGKRTWTDDPRLRQLQTLCSAALFAPTAEAATAIEELADELTRADARTGSAIRRRLEALAFHRDETIRARAYRTLVLDLPVIDYDKVFPAFLESGRSFLTDDSIAAIATARHGERRLQGLRQRLYSYRTRLEWPGPAMRRRQLRRVFRLLADFARHDLDHFNAVHAELAAWALFRADPVLARAARRCFDELTDWLEARLRAAPPAHVPAAGKVVFEFGTAPGARPQLEKILFDETFLRHSIMHAFNDDGFAWERVAPDGVWVSPLPSHHEMQIYRVAINLTDGRHFDLLLATGSLLRRPSVGDTMLWLTALSSHAFGAPALPRFGSWRRDLGAVTIAYLSDLTAWDRIRELSSRYDVRHGASLQGDLRKLHVRGMSAFFRAWQQSGYRIVPGALAPGNVALPDADFHERTSILSLAGWRPYEGPLSLVRPLLRNFYRHTVAHYPPMRESLRITWIFDACVEALGGDGASTFLDELEAALSSAPASADGAALLRAVHEYRRSLTQHEHVPLPVLCAIDRFRIWQRMNPAASTQAREETVVQMMSLYRIERFGDAFRYHTYRHTYFAHAPEDVDAAFAHLVHRCRQRDRSFAGQLEELSHVQALLEDADDRAVFSRMVFPHARQGQRLEVLALGPADEQRIIIRSEVRDNSGAAYTVREPVSAAEVGQLYRLIMDAGYRTRIMEQDRQLVLADSEERIVGGLSFRWEEGGVVAVEAVVVAGSLVNRGLGGALLEDFCVRVAAQNARLVRTNFFLGGFFAKHGFNVDQRWGGVVRFLGGPA
jgi:long-chain acyl-CoA synthetase